MSLFLTVNIVIDQSVSTGVPLFSLSKSSLDVEQELVNICCDYSNCNSVKGFEIGTENKSETEDGWKAKATGSYWPVDEYGDTEDKMLFDIEFTAAWDGNSSYYDIDVDRKSISRKY